ncbi:MAG TPA: response regulator transcription factor [Nocardioides sp.]
MTRVMVVDDHELLADSLQAALTVEGLEVVRPSSFDASVLLAEAAEWSPQLVLLDLGLPDDQSTLPMVRPLVDLGAKVVMVTAETDRARHAECVAAGAIGIVSKTVSFDRLVEVVLDAVAGRPLMTNAEREDLLADLRQRRADESERLAPFEKLTERERQVLAGLMQGLAAEALANELFVSMATMRSHIRSILSKLGVRSQLAAVAMAQAAGWTP